MSPADNMKSLSVGRIEDTVTLIHKDHATISNSHEIISA